LDDESNALGLNAVQSGVFSAICFRYLVIWFRMMIKYLQLLLLLLHIGNIVFSPALTEGMTIFLKHFIAEHHRLFKYFFPSRNLFPEHHFMIHYPLCVRNIGPILHTWCIRYEAKHNFFKTQPKSLKNITMTLAKKHQHHMTYKWEYFSQDRLAIGPGKMVEINDMKEGPEIKTRLNVSVHKMFSQ
jgi:hypothetical protein